MISARVAGIPCKIDITHYLHQPPSKGSAHTCETPEEFYGFSEVEFTVCDQRGRPAPWLQKKLTEKDRQRIEEQIEEEMHSDWSVY